ncbi:DUF3159 domain-containing protein [Actinomyces sp. 2119]|uniref:DUF3159 domain-containing protein n=1 Tax=Actinomyces sp. 2119 TaxID=2321393 RepID=UPI000E6CAF68|nr:DUF3159 domain-containing protein [Actinomyces sp. 2119]RJF44867.1 DUF3159 domain-containing protein [Actinomyces sp. 2119]
MTTTTGTPSSGGTPSPGFVGPVGGVRPSSGGSGLGAVGAERFDALAAVGGLRGIAESAVPTVVFVLVLALRPQALVPALLVSLGVSALALVLRLLQRQGTTQAVGGVVLVLVSAVWAWRSGEASNFYATGLVINGVWLVVCLGSLVAGWPLVGVAVSAVSSSVSSSASTSTRSSPATGVMGWRSDPGQRGLRHRYRLGTAVLAAMFCLRLVVEVPLYLAGDSAVSALGVARLVLGVPLFALTLWLVWLLVAPGRQAS